jgi:seryl-tRNA synthetase
MPIDINLLRVDAGGDPERVKKSERDRFRDDSIVDQIIEIDNKWRKRKFRVHQKCSKDTSLCVYESI